MNSGSKLILILAILIFLFGCVKPKEIYKVDYDFKDVKFNHTRAIGYAGDDLGEGGILYFCTDDLAKSLELVGKDKDLLKNMLLERGQLGDLQKEDIDKYFSKLAMLSYLLSRNEKEPNADIMYKLYLGIYKDGELAFLSKYIIEDDRTYPTRLNSEELNILDKLRMKESLRDVNVNYVIYRFKPNEKELAFKLSDSIWRIVRKEIKDIHGWAFNTYLVKTDEEEYVRNNCLFHVVPCMDYLFESHQFPGEKIKIKEAEEIIIPELGFYWDSKLPGRYYVNYKEVKVH